MTRLATLLQTIICTAVLLPHLAARSQTKQNKAASEINHILARKVSLSAQNEDAQKILERLFGQVGANYAVNLAYATKLSVSFNNVPFAHALNSVLKSIGYWYRIADGVFTIARVDDSFGLGTGPQLPPPGSPLKRGVNFISAASAANRIRRIPGFRPEDGITLNVSQSDNALILTTQSHYQAREFMELLRLMDVSPPAMDVRADITLKAPGHAIQIYTTTAVAYNNTPFTLNTTIAGGQSNLHAAGFINGDASVTFDLNWGVTNKTKSMPTGAFKGKATIATGDTRIVSKCTVPLDKGRFAEIRLYLTPTPRNTASSYDRASWIGKLTIVKPFTCSVPGIQNGLALTTTDAFARELAGTRKYEVLKREEITKKQGELGIKEPATLLDERQVANDLSADFIAEGELLSIAQDLSKDGTPVTARLRVLLRNPFTRDVLKEADVTTTQTAVPGGQPESALRKAAFALALNAVTKLTESGDKPCATVLALDTEGGKTSVEINVGARDGVGVGQQMVVMRGSFRAAKLIIYKVSAHAARCHLVENKMGVKPEDIAIPIIRDGKLPH